MIKLSKSNVVTVIENGMKASCKFSTRKDAKAFIATLKKADQLKFNFEPERTPEKWNNE